MQTQKPMVWKTVCLLVLLTAFSATSHGDTKTDLLSDLADVRDRIVKAEADRDRAAGRATRQLVENRLAILRVTEALLEQRALAEETGVTFDYTLKVSPPNPERARALLSEIADAEKDLKRLEEVTDEYGAGLVNALALSTIAMQRQSVALLKQAYYANAYGLALPESSQPPAKFEAIGRTRSGKSTEAGPRDTAPVDPNFPALEYSDPYYRAAVAEGFKLSGRWIVRQVGAQFDDSPDIEAANAAITDEGRSIDSDKLLIALCREGRTVLLVGFDAYLVPNGDEQVSVRYRLGEGQALSAMWTIDTSNRHAGLWGKPSISLLKQMARHDRLFVRITERNGQRHDATFDLRGMEDVINRIGKACAWDSVASLTKRDFMEIQQMLKKAGFYRGAVDGIWGAESRRALNAFQQANRLERTGILDKQTLGKMGRPIGKARGPASQS